MAVQTDCPQFQSFFQAGFECTFALAEEGRRIDLLKASRHDIACREDYLLIKERGITTVREGLAWYQIDRGDGNYDFSRFEPMMQFGKEFGIQQIWDLNHYDYPEDISIFSSDFIYRFTEYAVQVVNKLRRYTDKTLFLVLWNEISYSAWMGGEMGKWAPYTHGVENGIQLKSQLVKATIAATKAIRSIDKNVRFIQVDPFMYRKAVHPAGKSATQAAYNFNEVARFQTWDMLCGKVFPELGGDPSFLDIIGVNYYIDNQQWLITQKGQGKRVQFERVPLDAPTRLTVRELLEIIYKRYQRPILISETGSYGQYRPSWWKKTLQEIEEARKSLPICGVCAYPTLDIPEGAGFLIPASGLWDFDQKDKTFARIPHEETWGVIQPFIDKWNNMKQLRISKQAEKNFKLASAGSM